ncbi:MAG: LysR family transcriptional regulator [Pseudomonadales bacterium]
MDIRQLQHLVALVELRTVHAAAQNQHISQPGLSGSIKRLEGHLGITLFEREGRGMQPNAKGKEFYHHAKHILEQVRLARADLAGEPTNLFVGVGEVRPAGFAAVLHDALLESYPNLSLTFVEGHFRSLYAQLENGDVDVAFVAAIPDAVPAPLLGRALVQSQWRVFCAAGHPLSRHRGSQVPIRELREFSWVKNAATPTATPFFPTFSGRKKNPLENVRSVTAGSQQAAIDLVLHTNLLGYGPRVCFETELAHGQAVELDLPIKKRYVTIMEVRRRDARSAVLDRAFAIAEDYYENHVTT